MVDDNQCPRCGEAAETAYHRYWECPANCHVENQLALRTSDYMRETASKEPAQLTRGIAPLTAYPKIPPPPEKCKVIVTGAISADKNGIVIFTDGSGGAEGSDVRLRRCGWAYIQMEVGTHKLLGSTAGVLEGPAQIASH